jgi:hypothetical protein
LIFDSTRKVPAATVQHLRNHPMKKSVSSSIKARVTVGTLFFLTSFFLAVFAFSDLSAGSRTAQKQLGGAPMTSVPQTFSGTYDATSVFPCSTPRHHFTVPTGQVRIVVNVAATLQTNDLTLTLLYGSDPSPVPLHTEDTGVGTEAYNYEPGGGVPPGEYQVQICESPAPAGPSMAPFTYTGTFTYDDTAPSGGNPPVYGPLPPAPQDSGPKVGYENFEAPGVLTPIVVTSSGGATVEYLGRNAGEPSIGANWNTGVINFQSDLETLFISFDDSCSLTNPKATWVNRRAPSSVAVDSDPIGFTDRQTGRVFAAELTLLSPDTCKISFTDSDGLPTMTAPTGWTPAQQAQGPLSAVDHESMGGGPYHTPIPAPPAGTIYPNAVYYCSQDIGAAFCARSDDGGLTLGTETPLYSVATCGGLHGHVKVAPDGTVYVPNRDCGGTQSVVVSQDNGITWTVHPVDTGTNTAAPSIVGGGDDPAVAIDGGGRVYFAFSNFGGGPGAGLGVALSDDFGATWKNMFDVGAIYGLQNVCFPAAVAGDAGRAAIAFYGSTTPQGPTTGDSSMANFTGVWHLYIAHTFDGGKTWTTTDATPNMPMQRSGLLRGGGADITRNLLDFFDVTVDRDGRVLAGYVNGCSGGNCAQGPIAGDGSSAVKGNAYSVTSAIARQSSGRRMLSSVSTPTTSVPGMPFVTERRIGNTVSLAWSEADSGNSMINNYQIFRGTASGAEGATPIATVAGTQIGGMYIDTTATDPTKIYYYKVVANNSMGPSCSNNEIAAPFVGDTCTGIIIHKNDPTHPESTGGGSGQPPPLPSLLIDYVAVSEPPATNNLTFTMKVGDLSGTLPANSRWRIAWDWFNATTGDEMYYIGMNTDNNSAVTFEYGTLADAGVPAVLVLGETKTGVPTASFNTNGTITMTVPKSAVGSPQLGDLLGAIGGKTITGDTPATVTFERSTAFVDHTFIKGQADNSYPAATYTVVGNTTCSSGTIVPVSAVSRKTHGTAGDFNIDLPLNGPSGIESRSGGTAENYRMVITFASPVTISGSSTPPPSAATVTGIGTVTNIAVNGSVVTVDLTGVDNQQIITLVLNNVSDGLHSGNVAVPMGVLIGDVNVTRLVNSTDASIVQSQSGRQVTLSNFRDDVNANGLINSTDATITQSHSGTGLP